jgi:hypothetical protein
MCGVLNNSLHNKWHFFLCASKAILKGTSNKGVALNFLWVVYYNYSVLAAHRGHDRIKGQSCERIFSQTWLTTGKCISFTTITGVDSRAIIGVVGRLPDLDPAANNLGDPVKNKRLYICGRDGYLLRTATWLLTLSHLSIILICWKTKDLYCWGFFVNERSYLIVCSVTRGLTLSYKIRTSRA